MVFQQGNSLLIRKRLIMKNKKFNCVEGVCLSLSFSLYYINSTPKPSKTMTGSAKATLVNEVLSLKKENTFSRDYVDYSKITSFGTTKSQNVRQNIVQMNLKNKTKSMSRAIPKNLHMSTSEFFGLCSHYPSGH